MSNDTTPSNITLATSTLEAERPNMVKRIDGTTFDVYFHFSQASRETFADKVLRIIRADTVTSKK